MTMAETRLGLAYSDGSFTVLAADHTIETAREEARWADEKETNPDNFTRIVRVQVSVIEQIETPKLADKVGQNETCRHCGRTAHATA